jgi:hypothetical protein
VNSRDLGINWAADAHLPAEPLPIPEDVRLLAERIGLDPERVRFNCHGVSLAIVQSGIYPGARVARGWARGVRGQHSWVVADGGVYDLDAHVIDATLWSYDPKITHVWQGSQRDGRHRPHGAGHFMEGAAPKHTGGETVHLSADPGPTASRFLRSIGAPFDVRGWVQVANLPVDGWPAREVIEAMLDTPALAPLVPLDIAGHLTDRNPGGLYLPGEEKP